MFGDSATSNLKTVLQFYCSNSTVTEELALELEMNLQLFFNAQWEDFLITMQINQPKLQNSKVIFEEIPMHYHDYDNLLTSILV
jgi:hypothetical protein